ncbi:MAG: TonB family protein [Luteolibacter sp.]
MTFRLLSLSCLPLAAGVLVSCQSSTESQRLNPLEIGHTNAVLEHQHVGTKDRDLVKPLRLVSAEKPVYPAELQDAGIGGAVVVSFVVTEKGRVESAKVVKSSDHRLNAAALESTRTWKFDPPMGSTGPCKTQATQRILFSPEKGDRGFSEMASQLGTNVMPFHYPRARYRQLWADKPAYLALLEPRPLVKGPKPIETTGPQFPQSLYVQGGKAALDVSFVIAENGSVEAVRIIESTNPAVNSIVEKNVRGWRYEPARSAKGPVKVLWEKRFVFGSTSH